jgi:transposase
MTRKERTTFTAEQKLEYAKLMINEGSTNKQIRDISGAGETAISRWKKQLWRAKRDNEILKKAAAFFARENSSLN